MGFCDEKEAKRFFEERPFSNDLVANHILNVLVIWICCVKFYNELSIVKTSKALKKYSRSYSIEIIDS